VAQKDYLDLLVLIQEFGLPPELANETFETFEIQGRHSKIVISYDVSINKQNNSALIKACKEHPLFISSYGTGGATFNYVRIEFWMSMKHKEEDMAIQRDIKVLSQKIFLTQYYNEAKAVENLQRELMSLT
jgi:hypothetical protein